MSQVRVPPFVFESEGIAVLWRVLHGNTHFSFHPTPRPQLSLASGLWADATALLTLVVGERRICMRRLSFNHQA